MDDLLSLLEQFRKAGKRAKAKKIEKPVEIKPVEFISLAGFAEFEHKGKRYAKLARSWAIDLDSQESVMFEGYTKVYPTGYDYLNGSGKTETVEEPIVSKAIKKSQKKFGKRGPSNTKLQSMGLNARQYAEMFPEKIKEPKKSVRKREKRLTEIAALLEKL